MPYLLTAHADPDGSGVSPPGKPPPAGTVVAESLAAMEVLGKAYEDEYPNEVIEKRQYGVDGSRTVNRNAPPVPPFTKRPRVGARLWVRSHARRFLKPLVRELANWPVEDSPLAAEHLLS